MVVDSTGTGYESTPGVIYLLLRKPATFTPAWHYYSATRPRAPSGGDLFMRRRFRLAAVAPQSSPADPYQRLRSSLRIFQSSDDNLAHA